VLGSSAVVPLSGSVPGGLYAPPSSSPPSGQLIPSSLAHVEGLLAAAFTTYGSDGRVAGVTSYAMGPAGLETASDEQYEQNLSTRTATRIVHTASGNVRWEERWDGLGRLVSSTNDLDHALTVTYPSPTSRELTQRGPDGSNIVTTEHLDDFGGVLQQVDGQNNVLVDRITDAWGRTTQETGAGGDQVDVTYDAWSRVESVTQHAAGDPQDVLVKRVNHFDERGRLSAVQLGDVPTASFAYDRLGRMVRETRAGRDTITRYVAASNQVLTTTMPSGRVLTYEYNDSRRLVSAITADASNASGVIGPAQQRAQFTYDPLGQLQRASLSAGGPSLWTTELEHDGVGRLRRESAGGLPSTSMKYGMGLGMTRQTIGAQVFDFNRRADGRLQQISRPQLGSVVSYAYQGAGPASQVTLGNGLVESRVFDHRGRIEQQNLGSVLALTHEYGSDGNTRQTKMTGFGHSDQLDLELDKAVRVVGETLSGFTTYGTSQQSYQLDAANNWKSVQRDGQWFDTEPDASHAYAAVPDGSATYDEDGRQLTVGEESTFGYDAFGRLAEVHNENGTCNYDYDALGRRVREDCDGEVVLFGYSGPNLVVEQRGAQAVATVHAGLSAPVFRVPLSGSGPIPLGGGGFGSGTGGSEATYLLTGKDGSVRAALNQSGQVVETYTYSAFGETSVTTMPGRQPTGNRFGFQGHYHDPSTGLYQMRARYYAPRWGRFLTPDPLGVAATGNPYAFVGNRPGDLWDPFGLSPVANPNGQSMNDPRFGAYYQTGQLTQQGISQGGGTDVEEAWAAALRGLAWTSVRVDAMGRQGLEAIFKSDSALENAELFYRAERCFMEIDGEDIELEVRLGMFMPLGGSVFAEEALAEEALAARGGELEGLFGDGDIGAMSIRDTAGSQVEVNAAAGAARELDELVALTRSHPGATVLQQRQLLDASGRIVLDPVTGTGRTLDFVVADSGGASPTVVDVVEMTSLSASKAEQLAREGRIMAAGGRFVRDPGTGSLLELLFGWRVSRRP
jgi:RHS repeat-associated protein